MIEIKDKKIHEFTGTYPEYIKSFENNNKNSEKKGRKRRTSHEWTLSRR